MFRIPCGSIIALCIHFLLSAGSCAEASALGRIQEAFVLS